MAFSDWDTHTNDPGNVNLATTTMSPIVGTQSLLIEKVGSASNFNRRGNVVVSDASGLDKGEIKARMRTLWSVNALTANHGVYIIGMQNNEDVAITNSSYYACVIIPSTNLISIRKYTSAGMNTAGTSLAEESTPVTIAVDTLYATELLWYADVSVFGGTKLTVKFGTANDYSDLTEVTGLTGVVDASSPHLTSVAEGVGWSDRGSTGLIEVRYDKTELYRVEPV